eukprot:FN609337.1.p3 GENE.FN609337.1~~FN609337.1.p3  ORF type:complete len:53 (-),score=9.36 FN609337.1:17-175(-)
MVNSLGDFNSANRSSNTFLTAASTPPGSWPGTKRMENLPVALPQMTVLNPPP